MERSPVTLRAFHSSHFLVLVSAYGGVDSEEQNWSSMKGKRSDQQERLGVLLVALAGTLALQHMGARSRHWQF